MSLFRQRPAIGGTEAANLAEALIRAVWIQQGLKRTNDVGKYRKKWRCARDTKVGCEVDGMPR